MISGRILGLALLTTLTLAALGACGSSDDGGTPTVAPDGPGPSDEAGVDGYVPPVRREFGLDTRPSNTTCNAPDRPPITALVKWERVFATAPLALPMMIAQIPGDSTRWFVAQRGSGSSALIRSFPVADPSQITTVATIANINFGAEGGLLGLAFHPKFAQNGRLYVTWTMNGGVNGMRSTVGYLTSADGGATFGGPPVEILGFDQTPAGNHKGGGITFGKDGLLYLSFGDGGGGDDTFKNGQTKTGFFSKILRIDVDNPAGGNAYGIPATNPFKNGGGEPAVFAYGFRNPFRFSVDRESNEVWVGDVGQNFYEEVDAKVKVGGNYGWPCREGFHDYLNGDTTKCPGGLVGLIDPDIEQHHAPQNSRAIIGGVVYRGKAIPDFVGTYLFGDHSTQEMFTLAFDPGTGVATDQKLVDAPAARWVSFAEDNDGEVYAVALEQGQIYKLLPAAPPGPNNFPDRLSKTGCVDPGDAKKPASGLIAYGVNAALWSDGAVKDRWMALPDGQKITVNDADGHFDYPAGSVLMKTFTVGGKRIETRLFVRHGDGGWAGYTYEWLDDQSDALFLKSSKTKPVGAQMWTYPSRSDCVSCHTEAAGRSLGPELGQLNGDYVYPTTNFIANQLKTLDHIGVFDKPLGKPVEQLPAYPDPYGTEAVDARARAYLHSNCSNCHRPQGGGRGNMDLRFGTALADTKSCGVDGEAGNIGIAGAKLLAPGSPSLSLISARPHSPAAHRMPPLASSVVDDRGVTVIDDWITSIKACP